MDRDNGIQLTVETGGRWATGVREQSKGGHITDPVSTHGWDQARWPRAVGRDIPATCDVGSLGSYLIRAPSSTTTIFFSLTMSLPPNTHEDDPRVFGNQEQAMVSMYVDAFRCIL